MSPLFGIPAAAIAVLAVCFAKAVQAQQEDEPLGAVFDDSAFFDEATEEDSWLDGFSVRLSQQFFGQVSEHRTELAPGFALEREPELENNRLGVNIRYQNAFAPGWLLQASAQARYYWRDDYEYEAAGDNIDTEYRVNEFFVQRSAGRHSLRLGRQTVVWGETVGNSVLDVINTSEFRDLTIIDIEDARLNQWMLLWDYYYGGDGNDNGGSGGSLSTFVNLYPEFNPPPVRGSPFFFEPPYNLTDYKRDGELLLEAGLQWHRSFTGSDIALMAAYLYENQLRYEAPLDEQGRTRSHGDAVSVKDAFILLGFSANRAIGRVLLNFDLAFSGGVPVDALPIPGVSGGGDISNGNGDDGMDGTTGNAQPDAQEKDRIGTSFGFEWAVDNEQNLSLGIQAQKVLDARAGLPPGQRPLNDGLFGSWLLRYSNSLRNGDLLLSATMQGDLEGDSLLAFIGADYTLNDRWSLSGQIIAIRAAADSPLLFLDKDLRVGATLSYSF